MAVTVSASKSGITGPTSVESNWVTVYNDSTSSGWYLQAKAKWTIAKSSDNYYVSATYYIRLYASGGVGSSKLYVTAMSGGSRTGFDTLGTTSASFSEKYLSSLSSSQTQLGSTTGAKKDLGSVYTDTTSSGSLLYYIKLKVDDQTSVNVNFTFNGTFYGTKIRTWDISYYANSDFGGNYIDGKPVQDGKSYTVIKAPTRTFDDLTFNYYVSFNTNGGIPSQETRDRSTSQTKSYKFNSWSGIAPGTILIAHDDRNFIEQYSITYGALNYKTVGSLPTVYKKGYLKTNEWYYSNGTMASSSDEVKSSFTLSCKWEPQTYQIRYNLNGGQMPEDMGKISDYTMDKVYGVNTVRTPNFTPIKVGYTFAGWSDQNGSLTKVGVNSIISDTYYNAINTEYTNSNVTLYAQWTYKVNTLNFIYYLTDSGAQKTDQIKYNIDTTTDGQRVVRKYAPSQLRDGDYVFLGWCNIKPKGWDSTSYINNGYHGTYAIPPEGVVDSGDHPIAVELPVEVDISKLKTLESWGGTYYYYGIWSKSGKYMKINNSWKKVTKMYVKIDGAWKTITDVWSKQGSTWKHEI